MERTLSSDVFFAVHHDALPLFKEQAFLDCAVRKGLDQAKVAELYNALPTTDKINQARSLAQAYNVQVVPMVIIDNKFSTDYEHTGMPSQFPAVVDALVVKARSERRQAGPAARTEASSVR